MIEIKGVERVVDEECEERRVTRPVRHRCARRWCFRWQPNPRAIPSPREGNVEGCGRASLEANDRRRTEKVRPVALDLVRTIPTLEVGRVVWRRCPSTLHSTQGHLQPRVTSLFWRQRT